MRVLENSDRQSLLAEALTTHGTALARLGHYAAALATFRRALDRSHHSGSLNRAGGIALTAFQELGEHLTVIEGARPISGLKFSEEVRALERDLIKHALEINQGSITYAARSLGMSYQALTYMLETRHKDLLPERSPVRQRQRK